MSATQATAIRTAVKELLHGSIGAVRTVDPGVFEFGVFEGQPAPATKSKTIDFRYTHRFDVKVGRLQPHPATPLSNNTSNRISTRSIEILIWTNLKATTLEDERESQRAQIEGDCDTAIAALSYRNNLLETFGGDETGIVSGLLQGADGTAFPAWEPIEEDWKKLVYRSRIIGSATVTIAQAVA